MDAPGFFAHLFDAIGGVLRWGEVDVGHHGEGISDGVVDGAFGDVTSFDVCDGDTEG